MAVEKIYVRNVSYFCTPEEFESAFSQMEGFVKCYLSTHNQYENKGFGFVFFDSREAVEKVLSSPDPIYLKNRKLKLLHYSNSNNCVIIKNIPDNVTIDTLKSLFEKFGEVTRCSITMRIALGKKYGFGQVEFSTEKSMFEALSQGFVLLDDNVSLPVQRFVRSPKRHRRYYR